jgi:uncharacterized repeat protein (TIGR01451 family)
MDLRAEMGEPKKADVVIAGGGIAGLYAAYRLRQAWEDETSRKKLAGKLGPTEKEDTLSVVILEQDPMELGGRLRGVHLPFPKGSVIAEVGAMRFTTRQTLLRELLNELDEPDVPVRTVPFEGDGFSTRYFLRGKHFSGQDIKRNDENRFPYHVHENEKGKTPLELVKHVLDCAVRELSLDEDADSDTLLALEKLRGNAAALKIEDWIKIQTCGLLTGKVHLRNIGMWNLIHHYLSPEAAHLVEDGFGYESIIGNWNVSDAIPWFSQDFDPGQTYETVVGGFSTLVDSLRKKVAPPAKDQTGKFRCEVWLNAGVTELNGHENENGGICVFIKQTRSEYDGKGRLAKITDSINDESIYTNDEPIRKLIAKSVILALPKAPLDRIQIRPVPKGQEVDSRWQDRWDLWEQHLEDVRPHRLVKIVHGYRNPWWRRKDSPKGAGGRIFSSACVHLLNCSPIRIAIKELGGTIWVLKQALWVGSNPTGPTIFIMVLRGLFLIAFLSVSSVAQILNLNALDPSLFRVTTFASGLPFPDSIQVLSDGSVTILNSRGFGQQPSSILRFTDVNQTGVADGPGTALYTSPVGPLTGFIPIGKYYALGNYGDHTIKLLQPGAAPAAAMTAVASLQFNYPVNWEHDQIGMAARPVPGSPGSYDLAFNLGAEGNNTASTRVVGLTGTGFSVFPSASLTADSLYAITIDETGAQPAASNLRAIATGIRNSFGMAFQPGTGDFYFGDNAMDTPLTNGEPPQADELNIIAAALFGNGSPPNFGFPTCYIQYVTGTPIGGPCVQPLVTFQPIPDTYTGAETEGATEIAFAPPNFPSGFNNGIFIGFNGEGTGIPTDEAGLVYYDFSSGKYLHFIESNNPAIGNIIGVGASSNALFVSDFSKGIVYEIAPNPNPPALQIAKTHTGDFMQGQQNATYQVTVSNGSAARPTNAAVIVTETVPSGMTLVSMTGSGWTCPGTQPNNCTRGDTLSGGASFPRITVTVNVAPGASSPQLNKVAVTGGGSVDASATDSTNVTIPPVLSIVKTHSGNFTQGQKNATYQVTVSNANGVGPTSGTVTVTEMVPPGLTLVSMNGGMSWACNGNTCTRNDALSGGGSYSAIAVTVNVAGSAASQVTNQVSVSGGGSAPASAGDPTMVNPGVVISQNAAGCFAALVQAQQNHATTWTINPQIGTLRVAPFWIGVTPSSAGSTFSDEFDIACYTPATSGSLPDFVTLSAFGVADPSLTSSIRLDAHTGAPK